METLIRDLRYALVTMRRTPALTLTVLLTFALGIGSTTAVFSVVHGMLLRPLPYPDPDQLVSLWEEHPGGTPASGTPRLSNRTYAAWSAGARTIESLGAYSAADVKVTLDEEPIVMTGAEMSPAVFSMLRAVPAIGRFFREDEAREGADNVVVLSDQFWRERFKASPDVLEQTMAIDGEAHTIVGVAPASLEFPDPRARFWVPAVIQPFASNPESTRVFNAIARLRPGLTPEQAAAEGTAASRSLPRPLSADLLFGKGGPVVVHARPFVEMMTARVRPAVLALSAAVILLLLIACANVANLLLSRGLARERELVIRLAVGASRGRLLRQLLSESAALSAAGGLLGLMLAWILVRLLPAIAPAQIPRLDEVRIDGIVLAFAAVASIAAGLAAGVAPALRASRFELYRSIRTGDASAAGSRGSQARRLRRGLLVVEAALAVILVVGAGLLARSFVRLIHVDAGYTADRVLTARVSLPRTAPEEQMPQLLDAALSRLRALPGVTAAGAGTMMPMYLLTAVSRFTLPEAVTEGKPTSARATTYIVTPGYAEALTLRLKEGRVFSEQDRRSGPRPVMVNEEFVRQYVGRRPVVGLRLGSLYPSDKGIDTEIAGVVGNVLKNGNDQRAVPEIYFMHGTGNRQIIGSANVVVRTSGNPIAVADALRAIVRDVDRRAVVERLTPMPELVAASLAQPRFGLTIVTVVAALALVLAAVGLYGVLSYGVSQRRRELGVRAALGADRRNLIALVLREALAVAITGAVVGLLAASALTRLMQALLFGTSPIDAVSFASALIVLLAVALTAAIVPAWRAATIDPVVALKE